MSVTLQPEAYCDTDGEVWSVPTMVPYRDARKKVLDVCDLEPWQRLVYVGRRRSVRFDLEHEDWHEEGFEECSVFSDAWTFEVVE